MTTVMTVTGAVPAGDLGVVLPHEHVLVDTLTEYRADGVLRDEDLAAAELDEFRAAGGRTVVELTTTEIGRDPLGLRRIAERTGLNIVMSCGHYRDPYLDRSWFDRHSVDAIAAQLVDECEHGVGGTGVRPGVIGEIGADRAVVSAVEERSLRAAARAHHATGLTISTHAARWPVGREQLRILVEEGVAPGRIVVGHCDTVPDPGYHEELAESGCYVELDSLGTGTARDDDIVLRLVLRLRHAGFLDRILLSHDVFLGRHLRAHGGQGYAHLLRVFRGRLLEAGLSESEVHTLLVENPSAALTGAASSTHVPQEAR